MSQRKEWKGERGGQYFGRLATGLLDEEWIHFGWTVVGPGSDEAGKNGKGRRNARPLAFLLKMKMAKMMPLKGMVNSFSSPPPPIPFDHSQIRLIFHIPSKIISILAHSSGWKYIVPLSHHSFHVVPDVRANQSLSVRREASRRHFPSFLGPVNLLIGPRAQNF
jgi:hypothetical protein